MILLMDGRRSVREIWELTGERMGNDQPTQDETIRLLAQLHSSDILLGDMMPDMVELAERSTRQKKREILTRVKNPMALRFSLVDPDRFLEASVELVRPVFSVTGFLLWLALVVSGVVVTILNLPELMSGVADRVLTVENAFLMVLVYPFIKALHELGHAYATKVWGGEVHEFGIMLLVLIPMPYMDASASSAFRDKRRRALVGAAGIMVELALAAVAAIVWTTVEPGLVRAMAFNVMLIGGVSTLMFNGNPLLRFDGYYVLTDLIEVPNLGTRANKYIFYLIQRYLFGMEGMENPVTATGERSWFVFYGLASFIYRLFIVFAIATFVASKLFFIGIIMAIWAVANMLVMPVFKGIKFIATTPKLRGRRRRAVAISAAGVLMLWSAVFAVPLPYGTVVEGVVWAPEKGAIRAETEGVIVSILATPGNMVEAGQYLIRLDDPALASRAELLITQLAEFQLRLEAVRITDRVQAQVLEEQVAYLDEQLELQATLLENLTLRAVHKGRLLMPAVTDLPGRYVRKGDLLGYVIQEGRPTFRVVVPQSVVDLVRQRTVSVEFRYPGDGGPAHPARIIREVPSAGRDVPSIALTTDGGGWIVLDPTARGTSPQALEAIFQFDVMPETVGVPYKIGSRVFVLFSYGNEAIAWRFLRSLRQILLSQFNV